MQSCLVIYNLQQAVWRISKLILIAYEKCLLLEINTVKKFLLFRRKCIIEGGWGGGAGGGGGVYLIVDTYNYFIF